MTHLSLSFLGGFEASLDAEPITAFGADKVRALLAYLAIDSARPHRRAELSALFWPDLSESKAAHNLSQTLLRLRKALREKNNSGNPPFLLVTTQDVQFNEASDWKLDVARFRALLSLCRQHRHTDAARCEICFQWRREAVELYRGDLLKGLFLTDSAMFEEWQIINQEELRRQALEAFQWLTIYYEQHSDFDQMQDCVRRQITLEPWSEEAQIQLMRALVYNGQKSAALKQYELFARALDNELGLKPSAEASMLYEQIRSGGYTNQTVAKPSLAEAAWLSEHGERRQITVLTCGHAATGDPEEIQEQPVHCEQHCTAIFNRFGGKRASRQGDVCRVYFGYPHAFEDAARRAVHSGLAVITALENDYPLSIGIHTGTVLVGEKRGHRWQDRDLIGAVPEIARECQRLAGPGEVFLSESARRLVQEYFEFQKIDLQISSVKGQPLAIYQARRERHIQNRLEWLAQTQRLTTFSGRVEELAQLKACHELSMQGKGQIVLLRGEPGIGKSRLVWEFKHESPETILWLSSRCVPHNQDTALHPLIELLEGLLNFHPADSLDLRREKLLARLASYEMMRPSAIWLLSILLHLPTEIPAPETITKAQRGQMRELFIALLKKRAAEQPIVLVIEDLHWGDPSTVEWLGQFVESLGGIRCLVLLTARPGFNPVWLSHHGKSPTVLHIISIAPLSIKQVEKIIFDLVDVNILDEKTRQSIVDHTDGNPLFVEELTKTLLEQSTTKVKRENNIEIPNTLIDSLVARLDRLGPAKEIAQWSAVLGREFSYPLLKACVPYDDGHLQDSLAQLIEAEMIAPLSFPPINNGGLPYYTFKHALVQEASYSSLLKKTRELYHQRVATTIEMHFPLIAETRPEVLAKHHFSAGDRPRAADYWLRAGERATAQGATLEALTFFNRSLEDIASNDHERRWQALLGREKVLDIRGERSAQEVDLKALMELAEIFNDDSRRTQAYLLQASYSAKLGNYRAALPLAEAASASAQRSGDQIQVLKALAYQAQTLIFVRDLGAAQQIVENALALASTVTNESVRALTLTVAAQYYMELGDLARSLQFQQQSANASKSAKHILMEASTNANLGMLYSMLGLYSLAHAAIMVGLERVELLGDRWLHANVLRHLGYVYWCMGKNELAQQTIEQALIELETTGDTYSKAACWGYLGYILESLREYEQAAEYLTKARAGFTEIELAADRFEAEAVEARVRLSMGQTEMARELAREVCQYLRESGPEGFNSPAYVYICLADVLDKIEISDFSARELVETGYRELIQRAENISDEDWRRSFLENVAENRTLVEKWSEKNRLTYGSTD